MTHLRFGLIGCGDIARKRIAPALRDLPNCELVAVSRANFAQAESFAHEFGARRWYQNWQDLVTDEEVDAVYIATPVHLHAAQTIAAAKAGKHVLVEKPMGLTVDECDRMIAAGAANEVRLGVAYYRRFYPVIERIKSLLVKGAIGRTVVAQINAFEWFAPEPSNPRSWLLNKAISGGGPMFDFGCHRIEVLNSLFGPVTAVKAMTGNAIFERGVEDTATALMSFADGVRASLTVTHAAREPQDTLTIFGTEGSLHVEVLNAGGLVIKDRDGERVEAHPPHANLHLPLIDDFAGAVLDQREPRVNGQVGRETARVIEEIYRDADACATRPASAI
ncbi:MAG: Gfo/Idh/MocA family oxidoreductase [Pyrinomonadaceae bacterium]